MFFILCIVLGLGCVMANVCETDEILRTIDTDSVCMKKIATVLATASQSCNENVTDADISLNGRLQTSTMYSLAATDFKARNVSITGDLTAEYFKTEGVLQVSNLNVGLATGAPEGWIKLDGTDASTTENSGRLFMTTPEEGPLMLFEDAGGTITASLGSTLTVPTVKSSYVYVNANAATKIPGNAEIHKVLVSDDIPTSANTFKGPIYIEGGARIGSSSPTQLGYALGKYKISYDCSGCLYDKISLYASSRIFSQSFLAASDRRIKRDIEPVPDKLALEILRKLDAKYYHYKDVYERGPNRTIGFIAQEVREVIPEAVTLVENVVPDELRGVAATFEVVGEQVVMALAEPVTAGVYRFFVSKEKDASDEVERTWTTEDGVHFDVDDQYKNVYLYGRRHDDFHTINKQKIFAVAYAAVQQLDKNQQALQKRIDFSDTALISTLEKMVNDQEVLIQSLEAKLESIKQ